MHISKTDSHMDNHPVLLAIDKWWIILIRNGFNSTAKINLGDFSQSGCLFWFFIFIFSIQWRLIVTIGHSIKLLQSRFIPPIIKMDIFSNHSGKCFQSLGTELDGKTHTLSSQTPAGLFGCAIEECIAVFSQLSPSTHRLDAHGGSIWRDGVPNDSVRAEPCTGSPANLTWSKKDLACLCAQSLHSYPTLWPYGL